MRLTVLCVGRMREPNLRALYGDYEKRIGRYIPIERVNAKDRSRSSPSPEAASQREGQDLLAQMNKSYSVGMDAGGRHYTSDQLAAWVRRLRERGTRQLTLVVGGPWGLSQPVRDQCDELLSLSPLTLPHEMAQVVLVEQLYRAMTILEGHPYHH